MTTATTEHESALWHDPVMLKEVIAVLEPKPGMVYVDGTLGLAGHASVIWEMIQPGGTLVGTDWDESMLTVARTKLGKGNIITAHANYREIPEVLEKHLPGRGADAILLDLGLNSAQLEDSDRGIAFSEDGPLDMRMDRSTGEPATSLLNRLSEDQIEKMLRGFGGEKWSRRIAKLILEKRKVKPLRTTQDLVECVLAAIPVAMRETRIHPATRTFQAIRIAVNHELDGLEDCIRDIAWCLAPNGTLAVLSYHSGEDAPVKNAFRDLARLNFTNIYKKPLIPTEEEISRNRRSRSAKLRAIRKDVITTHSQEGI